MAHIKDPEWTADEVREVLSYDPETGLFHWLVGGRGWRAGAEAGYVNPAGYRVMCWQGKFTYGHRLAWLMMTGAWPKTGIDHRDLDPSNNRWRNLRPARNGMNNGNRPKNRNNTSGFKGVTCLKGRWMARCADRHLGYFSTPQEAHVAYCVAAKEYFGEFFHP